MKHQIFKILILITYVYSSSYTMEEQDQPTKPIIHFRYKVRCKSKCLTQNEDFEYYPEIAEFEEKLNAIAQDAFLELQELISIHLNLFQLLPEERLALVLKLHTNITKNLSFIISWHHQINYILNNQLTSKDNKKLKQFHRQLKSIITNIKSRLRDIDYLINITFSELSPITIELKLYIKESQPENSSYWTQIVNSIEKIFDFSH